jgi:Ca2+-dependent lipid-binding protein
LQLKLDPSQVTEMFTVLLKIGASALFRNNFLCIHYNKEFQFFSGQAVQVQIRECRDLKSKNIDAYVVLIQGEKEYKTGVQKSANPRFFERFVFLLGEYGLERAKLDLQVWDKNIITSNKLIGTLTVDLSTISFERGKSVIITEKLEPAKTGELIFDVTAINFN